MRTNAPVSEIIKSHAQHLPVGWRDRNSFITLDSYTVLYMMVNGSWKQNILDTGPKSGVLGSLPVNVRGST